MWQKLFRFLSLTGLLKFSRLLNLLKLYLAHRLATFSGKIQLLPPYAMSLELSSICNLKCPQCPVGLGEINREKKLMDTRFAMDQISRFARHGIVVNLYFQGESLLHHDFSKIASFSTSKKLYTILSTNGTMINKKMAEKIVDSGIQKLIISVDGLNQATYEKYRSGGNAEKVWEGVKLIKDTRQEKRSLWPKITVQTLVNRYNQNELGAIKKKALMAGADKTLFKTMQIYTNHENWLPDDNKYNRYRGKQMRKKAKGHCFRAFSGIVISADEKFLPCCYDKQASHDLGFGIKNFDKIVKSPARKKFLHQIYGTQTMHEICENCPEAMRVYK